MEGVYCFKYSTLEHSRIFFMWAYLISGSSRINIVFYIRKTIFSLVYFNIIILLFYLLGILINVIGGQWCFLSHLWLVLFTFFLPKSFLPFLLKKKWRADQRKKSTFPPSIFAKVCFSSMNSKTGQNTSINF